MSTESDILQQDRFVFINWFKENSYLINVGNLLTYYEKMRFVDDYIQLLFDVHKDKVDKKLIRAIIKSERIFKKMCIYTKARFIFEINTYDDEELTNYAVNALVENSVINESLIIADLIGLGLFNTNGKDVTYLVELLKFDICDSRNKVRICEDIYKLIDVITKERVKYVQDILNTMLLDLQMYDKTQIADLLLKISSDFINRR